MRRREFLLSSVLLACTKSDLPWPSDRAVKADDLAKELDGKTPPKIVHVGPHAVFKNAHVPGAAWAGEAGSDIESVDRFLAPLPRDTDLVLYCGCCPYEHCPNIRPAWQRATSMGFTRLRVLDLPTNLRIDWTDRGHRVET